MTGWQCHCGEINKPLHAFCPACAAPRESGVIIAGVRVATVISVGLATIAAAIGAGGLGEYIFRGLAMVNDQVILAGAIPAALMALLADYGLGQLEKRLTPRS